MPNTTIAETDTRAGCIAGLRALADFLEAHPEIPAPEHSTLLCRVDTRADLSSAAKVAGWRKEYQADYFVLYRLFGVMRFEVYADRSTVCRKVVTGQRVVPAEPERIVDVTEWVCEEPSLLADGGAQ